MKNKIKMLTIFLTIISMIPISVSAETLKEENEYSNTTEVYFLEEEKDYLEEQEKRMNELGFHLEKRTITTQPTYKEKSANSSNIITKNSVENLYTADTVNRSDSRKGLRYLIDVAFNFAVDILGNNVKFVSIAKNFLNISPSSLSPNWQSGDKLTSTESRLITTDFYRGYDKIGVERSFYITEKIEATIHWDLYTKANGVPIREDGEDRNTFKTVHYDNKIYCFNKAAELRNSGVTWTTNDEYK